MHDLLLALGFGLGSYFWGVGVCWWAGTDSIHYRSKLLARFPPRLASFLGKPPTLALPAPEEFSVSIDPWEELAEFDRALIPSETVRDRMKGIR